MHTSAKFKAGVAASNVGLKHNAEHLEHKRCTKNVLESIFVNILMCLTVFDRLLNLSTICVSGFNRADYFVHSCVIFYDALHAFIM